MARLFISELKSFCETLEDDLSQLKRSLQQRPSPFQPSAHLSNGSTSAIEQLQSRASSLEYEASTLRDIITAGPSASTLVALYDQMFNKNEILFDRIESKLLSMGYKKQCNDRQQVYTELIQSSKASAIVSAPIGAPPSLAPHSILSSSCASSISSSIPSIPQKQPIASSSLQSYIERRDRSPPKQKPASASSSDASLDFLGTPPRLQDFGLSHRAQELAQKVPQQPSFAPAVMPKPAPIQQSSVLPHLPVQSAAVPVQPPIPQLQPQPHLPSQQPSSLPLYSASSLPLPSSIPRPSFIPMPSSSTPPAVSNYPQSQPIQPSIDSLHDISVIGTSMDESVDQSSAELCCWNVVAEIKQTEYDLLPINLKTQISFDYLNESVSKIDAFLSENSREFMTLSEIEFAVQISSTRAKGLALVLTTLNRFKAARKDGQTIYTIIASN